MPQPNKKDLLESKNTKNYLKYSGMGFQLIASLILGAWIGDYIDNYFQNTTPIALLGCLLFMLFATLFLIIRQLSKDT
jgi:ATP synthase protein I